MRVPSPCVLAAALCALSAHAQPTGGAGAPSQAASDWTYSAGAAVLSGPRFAGAGSNRTMLVPTFDIRYRDRLFINPIRGIGAEVQLLDGLKASASVGASFDSRKAKDDARLNGLGDIGVAPAVRLGLDYRVGQTFASAEVVSRLGSSDGRGTLLEAEAGYNLLASRAGVLGVGLEVKAMDSTYARNFFGVSAAQSAASGLPAFNAQSGDSQRGPVCADRGARHRPLDIFWPCRLQPAARRRSRQPDHRRPQPGAAARNDELPVLNAVGAEVTTRL